MTAETHREPRRSAVLGGHSQFVGDLSQERGLFVGVRGARLVAELAQLDGLAVSQPVEDLRKARRGLRGVGTRSHRYSLVRPRPFRGSLRTVPEPKPNPKTWLCRGAER